MSKWLNRDIHDINAINGNLSFIQFIETDQQIAQVDFPPRMVPTKAMVLLGSTSKLISFKTDFSLFDS